MSTNIVYTPMLKGKQGELRALSKLSRSSRNHVRPLIDIVRPKEDDETVFEKKLFDTVESIRFSLGNGFTPYVDMFDVPLSWRFGNTHPVYYAHKRLRYYGVQTIPVFSFDHDHKLKEAILSLGTPKRMCLRLLDYDLQDLYHLEDMISSTFPEWPTCDWDILIDLKTIVEPKVYTKFTLLVDTLQLLSRLGVSSVMVCASGFPADLTGTPRGKQFSAPRLEWELFKKVYLSTRQLNIDLRFGDYGMVDPKYSDATTFSAPPPKLRYATLEDWKITRGRPGFAFDYIDFARKLILTEDFFGHEFSWGDQQLAAYANENNNSHPGSPVDWISMDLNHHLEVVVKQASRFHDSVGEAVQEVSELN